MLRNFAFAVAALASFVFTGCVTDYALIAPEEIVYVEVEVPVEVEPSDTGNPYADEEIWVDHFYQSSVMNGIDILWVIDNSGSMNTHTTRLLSGIDQMMTSLATLGPSTQWRLVIISADATKSVLENQFPLTYGSTLADASAMFNNLTIGGREEGFDSVHDYIYDNSYASTWMRNDAGLLVVFVSDEEEQGDLFATGTEFSMWLTSLGRPQVYVASIVNLAAQDSICYGGTVDVGHRYMDATNHLSGVIVDICSEDWTAGVDDATNTLEPVTEYVLTHPAIESSIRVFVDGLLYDPSLWYYEPGMNAVIFTELDSAGIPIGPPPSSLVEIGYAIQ